MEVNVKKVNNVISKVYKNSIAEELGIEVGDLLMSINGQTIHDIIEYRFLLSDEYLEVEIKKINGEIYIYEIEKDYDAMDTDLSNKHLNHEYLVTGSCREGSIIDVNVVVEVSGQELTERNAALEKEWESGGTGEKTANELLQHTESLAAQRALTQLRNLCPDCKLS